MADLILRRRELMRVRGLEPKPIRSSDFSRGYVFACDLESASNSEGESQGFLDDDDFPGWDTWIALGENKSGGDRLYFWVPDTIRPLVVQVTGGRTAWLSHPELAGLLCRLAENPAARAICAACGADKPAPLDRCPACDFTPERRLDRARAQLLSENYTTAVELREAAEAIHRGLPPVERDVLKAVDALLHPPKFEACACLGCAFVLGALGWLAWSACAWLFG